MIFILDDGNEAGTSRDFWRDNTTSHHVAQEGGALTRKRKRPIASNQGDVTEGNSPGIENSDDNEDDDDGGQERPKRSYLTKEDEIGHLYEPHEKYSGDSYVVTNHTKHFGSIFSSYKLSPVIESNVDYTSELLRAKQVMVDIVKDVVKHHRSLKFVIKCRCEFSPLHSDESGGGERDDLFYLDTRAPISVINDGANIEVCVNNMIDVVIKEIENFCEMKSGLIFEKIIFIKLNFFRFRPLKGGDGNGRIPSDIANKKATLDVANAPADECFAYAVLAGIYSMPTYMSKRASSYKSHFNTINFSGVRFPVALGADIDRFERNNDFKYAIHVLGVERVEKRLSHKVAGLSNGLNFYKLRTPEPRQGTIKEIPLLLLEEGGRNHFVLIKNLGRLLARSVNYYKGKMHHCLRCLRGVISECLLKKHEETCSSDGKQNLIYPNPDDSHMFFDKYQNCFYHPYILVGDCETISKPAEGPRDEPIMGQEKESPLQFPWVKSRLEQRHVKLGCDACTREMPCKFIRGTMSLERRLECVSFSYLIVSDDDKETFPIRYHAGGEDEVLLTFLLRVRADSKDLHNRLMSNKEMTLSPEEQEQYESAPVCHLCNQPFPVVDNASRQTTESNERTTTTPSSGRRGKKKKKSSYDGGLTRVRNHDHRTG